MEFKLSKTNIHRNNAALHDVVACSLVDIFWCSKVKLYLYSGWRFHPKDEGSPHFRNNNTFLFLKTALLPGRKFVATTRLVGIYWLFGRTRCFHFQRRI